MFCFYNKYNGAYPKVKSCLPIFIFMEKLCERCNRIKKIQSFGKNNQIKGGYERVCKICRNDQNKLYRIKQRIERSDTDNLKMSGLKKSDWCKTYQFLQEIGYDVNKDIHRQFVEKHKLVYGKRYYKNFVKFLPSDCVDFNPDVQTDEEI